MIEPSVSRKIGNTRFAQLSLDAHEWKTAVWAEQQGLYTAVCKSEEELNQKVYKMASRLAGYPKKANQDLRKLHLKDTAHWEHILPKNAEITAALALEKATQDILKKL